MASGTQGATAPRYTDTPYDKIFDPNHPEAKKTNTLVMEYITQKNRYDWAKRDGAPIVGCMVTGAVIGGTVGGLTAGPPGAATGAVTGAAIGAGVGFGIGLFTAGIINYRAYKDWAKRAGDGQVAESNELMTGCLPSDLICSMKQSPMMCPMKHKTLGMRYDKDQIERLFSLPDENRVPGDTRPANTRLDPNTRQVISLEDFEFDALALVSIKTKISRSLENDPKLINARPIVKEGIQEFINSSKLDKKTHYLNETRELDKLLFEDKINEDQHADRVAELRKKLSML